MCVRHVSTVMSVSKGDRKSFQRRAGHDAKNRQLARGENLVGIELVSAPTETGEALTIEKVELHVTYRTE